MGWDEAFRLTALLARDPSSQVCAAINSFAAAWPVEAYVMADLYDLVAARWTRNTADPHKRPSDKRKPKPSSQDKVLAALAARGHERRRHV